VLHGEAIGRRTDLEALQRCADRVQQDGTAVVATIVGEAGIGKTTVLDAFGQHLADRDVRILRSGISPIETMLAWAGLQVLLAPEVGGPAVSGLPRHQRDALLGALGQRRSAEIDAGVVALAVAGVLQTLGTTRPVGLLLDDLHWLDQASAAAISFAIRASSTSPLLVVVAARPGVALPIEPQRLLDPSRVEWRQLTGLSPAAVHRLLVQNCGIALRRPDLIRVHEATRGNPLHALEVGRSLATGATLDQALLPPSLQATIAERLGGLPTPTRNCLEVVALAAAPTLGLVAASLPDVDVEGSLLPAEEEGIVTVMGDGIAFTHPLLRAGVLDGIGGLRRRRLLVRLADGVSDPDERAVLLADSTTEPDETLATDVERAGDHAVEQGAPLLASSRYRTAALLSEDAHGRARRLFLAAETSFDGGDPAAAIAPADEACTLTDDPEFRSRAGLVAVVAVAAVEPLANALQRAEELLADVTGHPVAEARVLRTIARIRAFDDLVAAEAAIERAADVVAGCGDPDAIADVAVVRSLIRQLRGLPVDVDEITELARRSTSASLTARSLQLELLTWTDRLDEAVALGEAQLAEAEQQGSIDNMGAIRDQLADSCFRAGLWPRAVELVRATLEADRLTMTKGPADCRPADLAQTLAAQGEHVEAFELLAPVLELDDLAPVIRYQRDARAGFILLADGQWAAAADRFRSARSTAAAIHEEDPGCIPFRADLVEALLHIGALDEAAEVAAEHRRLAERSQLPRGYAESARSLGLVAAARGDLPGAIAWLEEALTVHASWPVPFEYGRALLALGATLRRAGRRSQAAERLDEAAAVFERLGARPWLDRVAAERARLGSRRTSGDELTPTEQRIAELVAAGRTNAEVAAELVISLRTVESNLTRTYRKLGVRSRTELAAHLRATA
jgi:DNA-binding CsgD family transcriptional regulator